MATHIDVNGDAIRVFMLGMYSMFCVLTGIRFVRKSLQSSSKDSVIAYRLTYMIMFLLFAFMMMSLSVMDIFKFDDDASYEHYSHNLIVLGDLLAVPLCGLLLIHLTHAYEVGVKRSLIHVGPFALLFLYYLVTREDSVYKLCFYMSIAYAAFIYVLVMARVYVYQKTLRNTYSDSTNRSLAWVYLFLNLLLLQNILYDCVPSTTDSDIPRTLYYVFSILNWSFLAEMLGRQMLDVDEMKEKLMLGRRLMQHLIEESEDETSAEDTTEKMSPIDRAMQRLCSEEQIYLEPDLTCNDLARACGTNRTYMSMWFRNRGTTFSDYINGLRLKQAELLLRTTTDNILTIGSKCGFNHPNTFRNVFKDEFGCTPKEYRKRLTQDEEDEQKVS